MVQQITEHFSYEELISSATAARLGIDNSHPSPEVLSAAAHTATCMETVRDILNVPIHVDSFIRCPALNEAVGSKPTSQHIKGEACDFTAPDFGTPLEIAQELIKNRVTVKFDQLIMEGTWVHISFCSPTSTPRDEVLSLIDGGHYAYGLADKQGNPI